MGLKDNASLALIPAAYKTSKIYSALPTDGDGDFTFTRSGNATRVNKAGLVETMGTNIGRLNYDLTNGTPASCPSLLLENSRTNSITYSEDFSNGIYNKNNANVTVNNTTAPDGTNNADKITSTGTAPYARVTFTHSTLTTYTVSIFAKKGDENYLYIRALALSNQPIASFNLNTGALGTVNSGLTAEMQAYSNGWYRCIIKYTTTSSISNNLIDFGFSSSDNSRFSSSGKFTYFWGAQVEAGTYPTSYIPTIGSAVTRTVDKCFNGGDSTLFDLDELTFFVDVTPYKGSTFHYVSLNDGSNQNRIIFIFNNNNTSYTARVISSGSTQLNDTENITFETRNKIAIALKANDTKVYLNGSQVASDTTFTMPVNLDRLNFSIYANSNNFFEGKVHQVMVFNERLSDSELQTLTS